MIKLEEYISIKHYITPTGDINSMVLLLKSLLRVSIKLERYNTLKEADLKKIIFYNMLWQLGDCYKQNLLTQRITPYYRWIAVCDESRMYGEGSTENPSF